MTKLLVMTDRSHLDTPISITIVVTALAAAATAADAATVAVADAVNTPFVTFHQNQGRVGHVECN